MCLYTEQSSYKIAKKDIIVYKHVDTSKTKYATDTKDVFYTSYRRADVVIEETYKSKLVNQYGIVSEGLHSFVAITDARGFAKDYNEVLVQCTIPKGARYYLGIFAELYESYASNRLRYDKVIKSYAS